MSKQTTPSLALVETSPKAANEPAPGPAPTPAPAPKTTEAVVEYHEVPVEVDEIMCTILSWPRDHDSPAEQAFSHWLRNYIESDLKHSLKSHAEGAFSVTIPRADGKPSAVLFSCHIDTVDELKDSQIGYTKKLVYDANFGHIMLDDESAKKFRCLGADDGVGIWIMLTMIAQGKPGTYLFHRGEECGGISAKAIAKADQEWLKTFDLAVAFDRPRDDEIITHQGGARCASDKAGTALAKALNVYGMSYKTSDRGVYTDTKEYRGLIPECFNVGVGYTNQHTPREVLDYAFCTALAVAALAVDWDAIPVDRTPEWSGYEFKGWGNQRGGYGGYGNYGRFSDYDAREYEDLFNQIDRDMAKNSSKGAKSTPAKTPAPAPAGPKQTPTTVTTASLLAWVKTVGISEVRNEVDNYPEETVDIILGLIRENARLEAENEMLTTWIDDAIYNGFCADDLGPH